jgi:hypothetical protein
MAQEPPALLLIKEGDSLAKEADEIAATNSHPLKGQKCFISLAKD